MKSKSIAVICDGGSHCWSCCDALENVNYNVRRIDDISDDSFAGGLLVIDASTALSDSVRANYLHHIRRLSGISDIILIIDENHHEFGAKALQSGAFDCISMPQ